MREAEVIEVHRSRRPIGRWVILGIALAFVLAVGFQSFYVVNEWEQAVLTQFGRPVGEPVTEAGLHFKAPFVQDVHRFDRRLLRWDGERHTTITKDRKTILVDVTARWRISDAKRFLMSVQTVERAHRRLDGIMESAVKNEIAKFGLFEVVRSTNRIQNAELSFAPEEVLADAGEEERQSFRTLGKQIPPLPMDGERYLAGRPVATERILASARRVLGDDQTRLGIELVDVMIKTFNYTSEVEQQVYLQMNEELKKISARFRSQGRRRAEEKRGQMTRDLERISSEAEREAERVRGAGDAKATDIYAQAYSADPDFYAFLRTLEAQKTAIGGNHTLFVSTSSPFYRLLEDRQLLERGR